MNGARRRRRDKTRKNERLFCLLHVVEETCLKADLRCPLSPSLSLWLSAWFLRVYVARRTMRLFVVFSVSTENPARRKNKKECERSRGAQVFGRELGVKSRRNETKTHARAPLTYYTYTKPLCVPGRPLLWKQNWACVVVVVS